MGLHQLQMALLVWDESIKRYHDKCCHLTLCLHLMEPNYDSIMMLGNMGLVALVQTLTEPRLFIDQ